MADGRSIFVIAVITGVYIGCFSATSEPLVVDLQQHHQQLICQVKNQTATSETGGWCNLEVGRGHLTDHQLAVALATLFEGRTVVGLGDGRGLYRKIILDTGKVQSYDAYDGSPNINKITNGKVVCWCFKHGVGFRSAINP